ncbi:MAG: S8 family serine peptidase [Bacteroidia bacterium]
MKKRIFSCLFMMFLFLLGAKMQAQLLSNPNKIASGLQKRISLYPTAYHPVMISLKDYVDVRAMDMEFYRRKATLEERTFELITTLKAKAAATQPAVLTQMQQLQGVRGVQPAWITNIIFAELTADAIYALSMREDLAVIDWDSPAQLEDFEEKCAETKARTAVGSREKGLTAINAHLVWALGYTGFGKMVMSIDTGVDKNHPAIKAQYQGNYAPAAQAWHESNSGGTNPRNCGDHGTHTVGTMVGLDPITKDTIGVAFGARWIASPGLCSWSNKYLDIQWAIDPDNNPNTIADQPAAINNSWYDNNITNECTNNTIINILNAAEAAGIAVVFSAGNEGSGVSTITPPKNISTDLVNVFCVGNLNGNLSTLPIASSSSRGPSICGGTGSLLIKPEVSAPGTDVRSCVLNNGYAEFTGTSMAAPHAAGAIALLKEAFPTLTGTQLKLALYYTCTDLGVAGEDNNFGMGIINVKAAYDYLIQQGNTPTAANNLLNAGALQITGITSPTCKSSIAPILTLENTGMNDLTSAWIVFNYDNLVIDSIQWTGLLTHGDVIDVQLPNQLLSVGPHQLLIEVKRPNNGTDQQPQNNKTNTTFTLIPSYTPLAASVGNICTNQPATLTASSNTQGTIAWYDAPLGGNLLGTGSPFVTQPINGTQTFYVDLIRSQAIGKADSSGGIGAYQNNPSPGLIFDAFHNCIIKQVRVYAQTAGSRIVILKNAAGAIVASDTIDMVIGEQLISLNFAVSPGNNYFLGLTGSLCKLYRNDAGVTYPYKIDEVISIKNSSVGTGKYYYFYDWLVEHGSPCVRNEVSVTANGSGNVSAAFSPSTNITYLNSGATVNFTDNSQGATAWAWNFGDGNTSTLQNPSHTYTQAGTYTVSLTANGGACTSSASAQITVAYSVGLDKPVTQNVRIYPNPTTGIITLETDFLPTENSFVAIYDVLGKEVVRTALTNASQPIDLQKLEAGTYWVKVITNKELGIAKVVLVK